MNRNKGFAEGFRCRLAKAARLETILRDRRGATALIFSVSAFAFIGLSGLATEGGTWYLEKRHGQNAADSAALAGAIALASNQNVTTSADAAAAQIGYPAASVVLTTGSSNGAGNFVAGGAPTNAVQAVVTTVRSRLFSGLFGAGNITIKESAVAATLPDAGGGGCMLAGANGISFTGNTNVAVQNCVIASNATGDKGINVNGSATVNATGMVSSGGCNGCTGNGVTLQAPPMIFQPPTTDPFAAQLAGVVLPTYQGGTCRKDMPKLNGGTWNLAPSSTTAFCGGSDLKLTNNNTVHLSPRFYIFYDTNFDLQGGIVDCPTCTAGNGVTIILTGSNNGANTGLININGNATVNLIASAPSAVPFNSAFQGILFYRDSRASATTKNNPNGNANQAAVQINGGPNTVLAGGLYFPSSNVDFSGNESVGGAGLSTCTEMVGLGLTFTGNSDLNISGCGATGTQVAQPVYVAMVM